MKVLFLIRSLETGGAERQLVLLANSLNKRGHDIHVAVFYPGGPLELGLEVPIHFLHKSGRWDVPAFLLRLQKVVSKLKPDIVHGYLGTANLLASLCKLIRPDIKTVWGVRASDMELSNYGILARLHHRTEAAVSRSPDMIIANSRSGRRYARQTGFKNLRFEVVHNGIDTDLHRPDHSKGISLRQELALDETTPLIVKVARIDPMKDHPTFLKAAACLLKKRPEVHFLCVGEGKPDYCSKMKALAESLGVSGGVTWTGERNDVEAVYNAADTVCLASAYGEGFPNVLGEAMACGVRCVTTDVGDAAHVIGDTGIVVKRKDPDALCAALDRVLGSDGNTDPRQRIVEEFSINKMVDKSESLLRSLLSP